MARQGCNNNSKLSGYVVKPTSQPKHRHDNICFYNCFCNYVDNFTMYLLDLFSHFENNVMPFAGTITDQPAKILEAFNIFSYLKSEKMKIERKKQERKQNKGMR